jgi:succinoglycan biosynthesis protein ExoO
MSVAPDVSLIMANYNGARHLTAAIQSAIGQTLKSWELLLVDDASTDDSVGKAEREAGGDPRIRIIVQKRNRGPAAARNRALENARGRWIAVFDSDDLMLPQRLELLLQRARTDRAAIVADNLLLFSATSRPRPFLTNRLSREPSWIGLADFIESNCLYSRNPDLGYLKPMIRADIVRAGSVRYDEELRIGEDYNFLARLMAQGHRLRLEPSSLYLYRKHEKSISHRLTANDITALLGAERRFLEQGGAGSPQVIKALKRRQRSLQSLLIYDDAIMSIKNGNPMRAVGHALSRPHIWPLLTQPITVRVKRLAAKLSPVTRQPHSRIADAASASDVFEALTPNF